MDRAYVGVGSNVGDRLGHCKQAIRLMGDLEGCRVHVQTSFFTTEPVGVEGHDWYVNTVVAMDTTLSPRELLQRLLEIEIFMGRRRKKKWEPRTIDLDILLYGDQVIQETDLIIPHPLMHERRFVLVPLVQMAPHLVHPILGRRLEELLATAPLEGQAVKEGGGSP